MSENDLAELVEKLMISFAGKIATQADAIAYRFRNVKGDMALRTFAEGIRATNTKVDRDKRRTDESKDHEPT